MNIIKSSSKMIFIFSLLFILSCGNSESTSEIESLENKPSEPVQEKFSIEQVVDDGKIYTSKDFFDAGFKEYKEYNVSKLTSATEAWYGFWGPDEDNVKYYELRFYPDHATAINEGTSFAENVTGKDAKLNRKEAMWRVGLSDRRVLKAPKINLRTGEEVAPKYYEYMIYSNLILLCQGWDSEESITNCKNLLELLN